MRGAVLAVVGIVGILIGAGVGYLVGNAGARTVTSTSTITSILTTTAISVVSSVTTVTRPTPYEVINPYVTVRGQAAGLPCAALEFPCVTAANQSISAMLIRYNGTYYYLSYYGSFNKQSGTETIQDGVLTNTWYTIWYDNSTVYCVSPKVDSSIACPA